MLRGMSGKYHSEETKGKLSLSLQRYFQEHPEAKQKLSLLYKGKTSNRKGQYHSEETKRKISLAKKGKMLTEEHKRKISMANMGKNKGKTLSEELRKKIGLEHSGDKCCFWQGGKSREPYSVDWTMTLRRSIRERDCYICQDCCEPQGDIAFDVHHIDGNKKNCNPDNLITLCRCCHKKRHWTKNLRKDLPNYAVDSKGKLIIKELEEVQNAPKK